MVVRNTSSINHQKRLTNDAPRWKMSTMPTFTPRMLTGDPRYIRHQKAVVSKDGSVIRLPLEHDADVNARADGSTPLHWTSFCEAPEVVRFDD
jgi:hypothetical protein